MADAEHALVPLTSFTPDLPPAPGLIPRELVRAVIAFWWASLSEETWRSYASSWKQFQRWCFVMNVPALPIDPWVVTLYLAANAMILKPSTLARHLSALQQVNTLSNGTGSIFTETVRRVLRGIKRTRGCRPEQKKALTLEMLRELLNLANTQARENARLRDRALFAGMFCGALRKNSAVILCSENLAFDPELRAVRVHLTRSKTDPFGEGRFITLTATDNPETDPVLILKQLADVLPPEGPLFRRIYKGGAFSDNELGTRGLDYVFRTYLKQISDTPGEYGTHSMRAGFVTEGKLANIPDAFLIAITGHASVESLSDYVRFDSTLSFDINRKLGL